MRRTQNPDGDKQPTEYRDFKRAFHWSDTHHRILLCLARPASPRHAPAGLVRSQPSV